MKIKKLTLHNVGVYQGDNELSFNSGITLIGGMNGRGKTTLMESILLALFGINSPKITNKDSYTRYLKSLVNLADGTNQSFIELTFKYSGDEYTVKRSWQNAFLLNEKLIVLKNGEKNSYLSMNFPAFIETVFPHALSDFFFFDGEKINELAEDKSGKRIGKAIHTVLGLSILDDLQENLIKIKKQSITAATVNTEEREKIKKDLREEEGLYQEIKKLEGLLEQSTLRLLKLKSDEENLKNLFSSYGGKSEDEKSALFQKRVNSEASMTQAYHSMTELVSDILPFAMVQDLLFAYEDKAKESREKAEGLKAADYVRKAYENYSEESTDIEKFIKFLYTSFVVNEDDSKELYNISDSSFEKLKYLNSDQIKQTVKKAVSSRDQYVMRKNELEDILKIIQEANDSNQKKDAVREQLESLEEELLIERKEQQSLSERLKDLESKYRVKHREISHKSQQIVKSLEENDDDSRINRYSTIASDILRQFKADLSKMKLGKISANVITHFEELSGKTELIENIEIDPTTLTMTVKVVGGQQESNLSAGEMQLLIISLIWALSETTEEKYPIMIDTPLSRLDSENRQRIVSQYFPNAGDQVVILSTDTEVNHSYYDLIKAEVNRTYILEYLDSEKRTQIKEGYFNDCQTN